MYLEERVNDDKLYLVDEDEPHYDDSYCWLDCSQNGFKEYGNGNKMFFFEGMGLAKQPFALDLIHADSKEEAELMVQERYSARLKVKTLIRKHNEVDNVIDIRKKK